jgi:hypothetical protein
MRLAEFIERHPFAPPLSTKTLDEAELDAGERTADVMHRTTHSKSPEVDSDKLRPKRSPLAFIS